MILPFSFYLFYYHYYYFFFPFFLFFYYTSCTLFPTNKPLHPQCRRLIILEYEGELYRVEVEVTLFCLDAPLNSGCIISFCTCIMCERSRLLNSLKSCLAKPRSVNNDRIIITYNLREQASNLDIACLNNSTYLSESNQWLLANRSQTAATNCRLL